MNDDTVLEFLEKLSKNPDNIKVDYDSDPNKSKRHVD